MMKVEVRKVESKREMTDFVRFPHKLYAGCPYYVPDMDSDVRAAFKTKGNACLDFTDIQAFIAYDEKGDTVGRIAGIINHRANERWQTKTVRFGYIEFVDDANVSAALLHAVEQWGKERGMESIQGPMGVFDYDKEGMLLEDFDQVGSMVTIYNYPYYPKHMEALGYTKAVDWVQIRVNVPKDIPARYARVAAVSQDMFKLKVKHAKKSEVMGENGYGRKVFHLMNESYAPLFGYTKLTDSQIDAYLKIYVPLLHMEMLSLVENEKGELIGAAITIPSLSEALRKSGGKLLPFGWFHLLKALKWKFEEKAEMFLIAVRPDYQGLGVNALFFNELIPVYNRLHFKYAETGPQLEDNVKELSQWKPFNPVTGKRRRCYKKDL